MNVREPVPGEILGQNYIIEQELGRGGFGVVYKARHIDIERVVAIKVLLATYAQKDPSAKERFKREATIAASLDYPNSLRIFDYGQTDEGVFYIVMEFLAGKDLSKVLRNEGRIAIPRAIHIIRQVLHALMEAHSRGIVHRDIKPDNVMLVSLAYDPDYVKVMDFGIAKMVDAGDQITRAGLTLGTPRYMPLEQLKGERLSPATDLYAVGLVLYEMLVGAPAFAGETAIDTALAVMQGGQVKVPPEAGLPADLAAIIEKAAAPNAEDRYQSARELLEALNTLPAALLDGDSAERERFVTEGLPSASGKGLIRKARGEAGHRKTVMMPGIERDDIPPGGDFEDALSTQAIETGDVAGAAAKADEVRRPLSRPERQAPTQALDVAEVAEVAGAAATARPEAPVSPTETALATSLVDIQRLVQKSQGPAWFGAPPILVVLNVALLLVALLTLFRILS